MSATCSHMSDATLDALEDRCLRCRRIADALRRDLITNPPPDPVVVERAWDRVLAHQDEAEAWDAAYRRARFERAGW